MKKRLFVKTAIAVVFVTALALWQQAAAQTSKKVIPDGNPSDTCMSFDGSIESKIFKLDNMTGVTGLSWSVLGDLEIVSTASNKVTVRSKNREISGSGSKGYGKGRVVASFTDAAIDVTCGAQSAFIDVYKNFQPDDLNNVHIIVGPDCIATNDTVTFSVNSRFISVNLDQNIGQDRYKWDLLHTLSTTNKNTVDGWELLYFSSDSSSVTFRVGTLNPEDTIIRVDLGKCNFSDGLNIKKKVGKAIPYPVFKTGKSPKTLSCVPIDTTPITLVIDHTKMPSGLTYTWNYGGWKALYISPSGDSIILDPADNELNLKVQVSGVNFCKTIDTTYTITRSLAENSQISIKNSTACVAENSILEFSVDGVPSGAVLEWSTDPSNSDGWSIPQGQINSSNPSITIGTLDGTVSVHAKGCTRIATIATISITIKPNKPELISPVTCLDKGDKTPVTYSIASVDHAASYDWTYPTGWTHTTLNSTSVTFTPDGDHVGDVIVFAKGCEDQSDTATVYFKPVKPDSIYFKDAHCLRSGKMDTLKVYVSMENDGQTYVWEKPDAWTILENKGDTLILETDGTDGSFDVKVRSHNSVCSPDSDWEIRTFKIEGLAFTGRENPVSGGGPSALKAYYDIAELDVDPAWSDGTTYTIRWTSVNSSGVRTDVTDYVYTPETITMNNFRNFITAPVRTTESLVVDVVKNSTGCFTRKHYGASSIPGGANFKVVNPYVSDGTDEAEALQLKPNPANTSITVVIPGNTSSDISIVDAKGNLLMKQKSTQDETEINVADLQEGLYTVIVSQGKTKNSKKLVISR